TTKFSTYVPGCGKIAIGVSAWGSENCTVPGPETTLHNTDNTLPSGRLSSVTEPSKTTLSAGWDRFTSLPALTTGAWFTAEPNVYSTWSRGAAATSPLYDSAVRVPLPAIM